MDNPPLLADFQWFPCRIDSSNPSRIFPLGIFSQRIAVSSLTMVTWVTSQSYRCLSDTTLVISHFEIIMANHFFTDSPLGHHPSPPCDPHPPWPSAICRGITGRLARSENNLTRMASTLAKREEVCQAAKSTSMAWPAWRWTRGSLVLGRELVGAVHISWVIGSNDS